MSSCSVGFFPNDLAPFPLICMGSARLARDLSALLFLRGFSDFEDDFSISATEFGKGAGGFTGSEGCPTSVDGFGLSSFCI